MAVVSKKSEKAFESKMIQQSNLWLSYSVVLDHYKELPDAHVVVVDALMTQVKKQEAKRKKMTDEFTKRFRS